MRSVLVHAAVAPFVLDKCLGFVCLQTIGDARKKSGCEQYQIRSGLAVTSIVSVVPLMLGAVLVLKN